MIRIAATLLESFRLYLLDEFDNEAEVIAHIKGAQVSNRKMQLGHAFHYLVEHPQLNLTGIYEHNGFRFEREAIDAVLRRLDPGVFETKVARPLGVLREGDELVLVAKADHIAGLHLSEFKAPSDYRDPKTRKKVYASFDAAKYMDSYQWRIMAMLYESSHITYEVACLTDDEEDGIYHLKTHDSFNVFPYPQLESDVRALVREFMRYVRCKKLDEYLRREDRKGVTV